MTSKLILLVTIVKCYVTSIATLNVLMASNCFWEEVGPNLAVLEELVIHDHRVVYACPGECGEWIGKYQDVEVLEVEGPGIQDLKMKIDADEMSHREFLSTEAEKYVLNKSCDSYQTILTYLKGNKVDVILATYTALGAIFAAEATHTPLLMNYNSITLATVTEYCQNCGHGETSPRLQYSGYVQLNIIQEFIVSVVWNMAPFVMWQKDTIINSRRLEVGLSSYYPKSALLNLHAIYPKIYPIAPPLISENVKPHEGRWIVGPLLPKRREKFPVDVLKFLTLTNDSNVLISLGGLVYLGENELGRFHQQLSQTKAYKTVWLLDSRHREMLAKGLGVKTLEKINFENSSLFLLEERNGIRDLLADIDLMVTTPSYTNIIEACVEGKPMLLVPTLDVEQTSAELFENLGCGSVLQPTDIASLVSSIEAMLQKLDRFSECTENVKNKMGGFMGAKQVVDIIERMGAKGYSGLDMNYQTGSVPDIINCWIAISLLLLQTVILILLGIIVVYNMCCRDWSQEEDGGKEKTD